MNINFKLFLFFLCLSCSCQRVVDKEYNIPINTINSIKHQNSYGSIDLTMEKFFVLKEEIIASFMYRNKKASIKLNFESSKNELEFVNIGSESDYFLYAISELFEEKTCSKKMKDVVVVSVYTKGSENKFDLFNKENEYALSYKPNKDEKGSVEIRMTLDVELGKITLWEKNGGIAKKNFVKAFEKAL